MISDKFDQPTQPASEESVDPSISSDCKAHLNLTEWQVRQYRDAVNENKWYMSERLGRSVDWEEAEDDFLHNGYYGCAPKWRKEYCMSRCHHFTGCKLGQQFAKQ
jgi:hypothetical protein